ncbi:putative secreted protein [Streptomyces davaonensis JCM 4913]|uniref:Putative secreted protein n=1 Tax=Streptomyces davaonensis (strain DSM 101723 / JCM 4913 / KCC S-0913 / 768) TaxID=1214101 RepID=K4RAG0_STRDJ|nr:hypothetical protein [Streptomyces davaonensis]CCK30202.1 putative secreted protein [Streptomyces davaonensis JCM 4913]
MDGAVWVAAFTGGTAVLASWVTNLGNVRAARAQAEASAVAQERGRARELRRAAYLDLMEQAHCTGELYWRAVFAFDQVDDADELLARVQELRVQLRDAYEPLMRTVRVIALEGPAGVAEAAEAVLGAAADTNRTLWHFVLGESGARERFEACHGEFKRLLADFVAAAREAMAAGS